ncbi:D-serine/D-alanine/glycine transporter [Dermatophilus congolensis]|uniref:D-serine/D-alanine/glycine transporter n=1 Tax=Dermatophilus congolensis TaxID=1863 RepID=UPI001AAEC6CE|nr:D-serine/D-alanine/glycine transporter [Dermatophilus congolensis]MBO3143468.1 D-serine/D-alanine/glycine transporter [Dermatophilus congolensis]MBO3152458.1 D-serine/D-alanine/glycine transporter [Dermatophilus congolensis]MBO3160530.1 D-serine/D-alanine/glycine transporter [Dermatophilus congolensis]MBO3163745.1 D-serine/D-alanine/glycine transporter [Dermatophilus congolensis]MBO3177291.1 D-serine/D-alanine/glycine transporter [Dermatophilus congolensis]
MTDTPPQGSHSAPHSSGHSDAQETLERSLTNRHIQLIAIGGAIGTGLFMGSGKTISVAGPSIMFVYLIIGVMLFFVMRAMGELLLHNLEYKSFQDFAAEFLGPWAGFFSGWTYWLCWVVTGMADVIAVAGYWNFWVHGPDPDVLTPLAIALSLITLLGLLGLNLLTVKLFGELEFWFAIIKVIAIVVLIVLGIFLAVVGFTSPEGIKASFTHLWDRPGGFFPHGLPGFFAGFQIAVFAFVGIELVGTTAAETADPQRSLPKAINSIPIRVVLFYVFALMAIMTVTPWDQINPAVSPFVNMFQLVGFAGAASIMNFVVLTSASSSANSGIFSTSRMLYGLAHNKMAPAAFGKLSSRKVPQNGLFLSVALVACAVFLLASDTIMGAFTVVTTISAVLFIFVWTLILCSYMVYRKRHPEAHAASAFKMPGGIPMCWIVLAFFAFVLVLLTQETDTLQALLVTPFWFIFLGVAWIFVRKNTINKDTETPQIQPTS